MASLETYQDTTKLNIDPLVFLFVLIVALIDRSIIFGFVVRGK
jgi:hypothetical protein